MSTDDLAAIARHYGVTERFVQWHEGHYECLRCGHAHYLNSRIGIAHHNRNREATLWARAIAAKRHR